MVQAVSANALETTKIGVYSSYSISCKNFAIYRCGDSTSSQIAAELAKEGKKRERERERDERRQTCERTTLELLVARAPRAASWLGETAAATAGAPLSLAVPRRRRRRSERFCLRRCGGRRRASAADFAGLPRAVGNRSDAEEAIEDPRAAIVAAARSPPPHTMRASDSASVRALCGSASLREARSPSSPMLASCAKPTAGANCCELWQACCARFSRPFNFAQLLGALLHQRNRRHLTHGANCLRPVEFACERRRLLEWLK